MGESPDTPIKKGTFEDQDSDRQSSSDEIVVARSGPKQLAHSPRKSSTHSLALPTPVSPGPDTLSQLTDTDKVALLNTIPRRNIEVRLPRSTLVNPRSSFLGWTSPDAVPLTTEHDALSQLVRQVESEVDIQQEDFIEFELDNFCVYVDSERYPYELRPLHHLCTRAASDNFYFDGVLSHGDSRFFVRRVPFRELPVGNYLVANHTVGDQIWIRSRRNESRTPAIYYKLGRPSLEYERFHDGFLWIADLAKHVVDFCEHMSGRNRPITLHDFRDTFSSWLQKHHQKSSEFRIWRKQHPSDDFRTSVTANVEYIYKEVYGILGPKSAHKIQLFKEIKSFTHYKPIQSLSDHGMTTPPTIVTPYVHRCFSHSEFGDLLLPIQPQDGCQNPAKDGLHDVTPPANAFDLASIFDCADEQPVGINLTPHRKVAHYRMTDAIKPGDTISTPPDGSTVSKWKSEMPKGAVEEQQPRWFGLVQKVHISKKGTRRFDVIWLYRPVDTPCCKMVYPWHNELFLSDSCNCEGTIHHKVDEDEVLAVHKVHWGVGPDTMAEFFVRQTYQVDSRRWISLERHHMRCNHDKPESFPYHIGDTVLVLLPGTQDRVEPYEVVKVFKQDQRKFVRLRRLLRRAEVTPSANARPNELVYTNTMAVVKAGNIVGRCYIRFFPKTERIPAPYDRDGTANFFFISHRLDYATDGKEVYVPLKTAPATMRQGFDPNRPISPGLKLRGLDLFCGSGNFGRGLEEGGVVNMRWANDIWDKAMHTYMANASRDTNGILGSVDDLLQRGLEGYYQGGLPRPGEVDYICGGSPCQGFSIITNDKTSDRQKKNRSLVASFASFVDFYRPKYGILENVPHIVQTGKGRDEDAFSQLICTIVGLGYQVQVVLGDAWAHGAPQSRSRVFLSFAAAGFQLPEPPRPTHSHPPGVRTRGLGRLTSGDPFVDRSMEPTPFKFVSAAEATSDLPPIYDGKADCSVAFPDHRVSIGMTQKGRIQVNRIPTHPHGMTFARTWNEGKGVMTPSERTLFPTAGLRVTFKKSSGWGRIKPGGLFHTITTCCQPTDARVGRALHWHEDRPITLMEARRAQGFPDHEVLTGPPADQYHLVGNSVARPMALALGLQLRKAWLGTLYDETFIPIPAEETLAMRPDAAKHETEESKDEKVHDVEEADLEDIVVAFDTQWGSLDIDTGVNPAGTSVTDVNTSHWDRKRSISQTLEKPVLVQPKRLRLQHGNNVDSTDSETDTEQSAIGAGNGTPDISAYAVHPPISHPDAVISTPTVVKLSPAPSIDLTGDDQVGI